MTEDFYSKNAGCLADLADVLAKTDSYKDATDGPLGKNKPDLSSLFCSEKEATVDMAIGTFRSVTPANEFTPDDYTSGGVVDKMIEAGHGTNSYGPQIEIEF